jgi:CRISPR-associated protein (TIGR03984 family)
MSNKIEIKPCEDISSFAADMKSWLEGKAAQLKGEGENKDQVYLLSFHDDGVVWGKIKDDGSLITSQSLNDDRFPKFRHETLQELRLFGEKGQLHIWRIGENQFKASLALKSETGEYEFLQDEEQVLHGTYFDGGNDDFMIVRDGEEGLRHAFPKVVDDDKFKVKDEKGKVVKDKNGKDVRKRPLRLHIKHYTEYDIDGCARIAFSRLVNVEVEGV